MCLIMCTQTSIKRTKPFPAHISANQITCLCSYSPPTSRNSRATNTENSEALDRGGRLNAFENIDWNMFKDESTQDSSINIDEYTLSVTEFIRKCVDDVVPTITIQTYPNQKLWMKRDICTMTRAQTSAFNVGRTNLDD